MSRHIKVHGEPYTMAFAPGTQHLRRNNDPPNASEEVSIRSRLLEARSELQKVDDAIARLNGHRAAIQAFADEHAAMLSPLRRFPNEILSEVALQCLDGPLESGRYTTLNTKDILWVLGQVCRSWRNAILSFPRVWSFIRITDEDIQPSNVKYAITELLRRSKDAPLFLEARVSDDQASTFIIKALVRHSSRWCEATIRLPSDQLPHLNSVKGRLPALVNLTLLVDIDDDDAGPRPRFDLDAFKVAPALRSVVSWHDMEELPISLPWSQLTLYDGWQQQEGAHLRILRLLTNVERCDLADNSGELIPADDRPTPILLPRLRSFKFTHEIELLNHLTLPALDYLEILAGADSTEPSMNPLVSLIARSSCSITSLSYHCTHSDQNFLITALRSMPTLSTLAIVDESTFDPDFLPHLIVQGTSEDILLPNLKVLKMDWAKDDLDEYWGMFPGLDGAAMVVLIESRRQPQSLGDRNATVASLEVFHFEIYLDYEHRFSPSSVRRFDEWRRDGMDIEVLSMNRQELGNFA